MDIEKDIAKAAEDFASREFATYFKYCSDAREVIDGIFERQKIRFTQPWAFNDPLEFNPTMKFHNIESSYQFYDLNGILFPSKELWYRVQAIESQINAYGILSLTKIPDSFDMWSQYSNGHRGFVLEFKSDFFQHPCIKSKSGQEYGVKKVEYVEDYAINLEELVDENNEIPIDTLQKEMFYKKTSRWENENEYRMVRPLTDLSDYQPPTTKYPYRDNNVYLFNFSLDCIESVIFGAYMSPDNKRLIASYCRDHNIPLHQAFIIRDQKDRFGKPSNIIILLLSGFKSEDGLLRTKPQVFCSDTIKLGYSNRVVRINKISDLPYYAGFEEAVEEFHRNSKVE